MSWFPKLSECSLCEYLTQTTNQEQRQDLKRVLGETALIGEIDVLPNCRGAISWHLTEMIRNRTNYGHDAATVRFGWGKQRERAFAICSYALGPKP